MADTPRDEHMIAALKRERAVYANRGDDDRVAQVDEQLKHYGYEGKQDTVPGAEEEPRGRRRASQQTAASSTAASGTAGAKSADGKDTSSSKTTTGKSSA